MLPGNGGRDLVFQRTFSTYFSHGWHFGIAGLPAGVTPANLPIGQTVTESSRLALLTGGPQIVMSDGAIRQTFYVVRPTWQAGSHDWLTTEDHQTIYNSASRLLYMPDGTVCHFNDPIPQQSPSLWAVSWCRFLFGCQGESACGAEMRNVVEWDRHSEPGIVVIRQHLGNGQTRTVRQHGVTKLEYLNREWHYTWTNAGLTHVQPPEGPGWTFTYAPSWGDQATRLASVTTPGGGQVLYTYDEHIQYYPHEPPPFQTVHHGVVLVSRESRDHQGTTIGTWQVTWDFDYVPGGEPPIDGQPRRPKWIRITDPLGFQRQYWGCTLPEMPEPYPYVYMIGGYPCGRDAHPYGGIDRMVPEYFKFYDLDGIGVDLQRMVQIGRRVSSTSTGSVSTVHHTDFVTRDAYRRPTLLHEYSDTSPGVIREISRQYWDSPLNLAQPEQSVHILNLLVSETITIDGENVQVQYSYDPDTGFRTWQRVAGIETTFTPDSRGNVAAVTTDGKTITYQYSWGQVSQTTTPVHTTTRVINEDGTIQSETLNTSTPRTTTYQYDLLGRTTQVTPPGNTLPILTSYHPNGRSVTTTRGPSQVTTTLDGFGRTIATQDSTGVRAETVYDARARVTLRSYPFQAGGPSISTQFFYDHHDRVARELHPDGSDREYTYGTDTVTVRDEEGRTTVTSLVVFGHPEDARVVQLVDAANQPWSYAYNVRGNLTSVTAPDGVQRTWTYHPVTLLPATETHPESGTTHYEVYDAAGILKQKRDANGTVFVYGHDNANRLISVTATPVSGPVQVTTIVYEPGSDNQQTLTVDDVMTVFGFDTAGRVSSRTDVVDGKTLVTTYTFDSSDRLETITYPNARVVAYEFDSEGRTARVFDPAKPAGSQNYASGFQYHPSGALASYTAGNGLLTTMTYETDTHRLASIQVGALHLGYSYDNVGNIEQITDSRPGMTQAMTYDDLDRLLTVSSGGGYPGQVFAYDAHGNRQNAGGNSYEYHAGNPFRLFRMNGLFNLTYDSNGNTTGGTFGTYEFTPDNLMKRSTVGSTVVDFAYDIDAWRVKKTVAGEATVYSVRGPNGQLLTEWTNSSPLATVRDYVYAGRRLLAAATTSAQPK